MPGTQLPSNDEELDAAMALAALVGGGVPERGSLWREDSLGRRGSDAEQRLDGISWTLRRRRSGSVIVVNEKGSPMTELSSKLAKMQEWEDRQRRGGAGNRGGSSAELSQSGLSEADAGGSDVSRAGGEGEAPKGPADARVSSLIPGVAQAKVDQAFEQGLEGIAALLKDERPPLIRAPSFPPQLSVNTLLPQLSMASQSSFGGCLPRDSLGGGLQSQPSLGLQSQRSVGGELQSQLSAPSAFLAAIAASLPPSASQPWPAFPTLANPLSNPVSNPIARAQSITEFQFEERAPAKSGLELPSPKLVDFLSPANQFSERDGVEQRDSELGGLKEELLEGGEREDEPGLGFAGGSRKRLARARRRKAVPVGLEDPDPAKEAQRLRRIQANRESARKTIMRKQAVCKKLATEAQELGDENLDLRSKVEAAQRELHRLITEQAKLKEQLMAAQTEAEEPLDVHPSTSAPLLPDLSDDRKSNDGLPKPDDELPEPAPGLENLSPDLDSVPEQDAAGLALGETAKSGSKEGLDIRGEGSANLGLMAGGSEEEKLGDRKSDELQTAQVRSTDGEGKGSGDGISSNPSAARSGEGSSMEPDSANPLAASKTETVFGTEKSPPPEPLSKRGSNESVTAKPEQPPGKALSESAFLRALAGGPSPARPSSLSYPPKTENAERPTKTGLLEKTTSQTGGPLNRGADKGGAEAEPVASTPVLSNGTPSGNLPDVSMSLGGAPTEQIPRGGLSPNARGLSSVLSTGGKGSGPDLEALPGGGNGGGKTSASPPLPLSLSLLHTIATELCSEPPVAAREKRQQIKQDEGKKDFLSSEGGVKASEIGKGGSNKGADDGGVKRDMSGRDGVNGDGVPRGGVNGAGPPALTTARSLPLNPWLSLRPQSLQRNLSAPMQVVLPPQPSGLEFFNLTALPPPKQANPVQNQTANSQNVTANPGSGLIQHSSSEALLKGSPFAKDGLNQDPFNPRLTSRQPPIGADLSLGSTWQQEGLHHPNPAFESVSGKSRFGGIPGQTFVPLQSGGSQNLLGSHGVPNPLWGDSASRGAMSWIPEGNPSGVFPNQGVDMSLSLQPSAPPRTVKPETGMYNVYRGSGRRGSVSLHIGPLPVVDAVTAAEARKRRREVTKSKFGPSGGSSAKVQKVASAKAAR